MTTYSSYNYMYLYFLLNQCAKYLDAMMNPKDINVDTATQSLFAFCPDVPTRDRLWNSYEDRKKESNPVTASIKTVGDFQAYLSEVLEFTEKSAGAF